MQMLRISNLGQTLRVFWVDGLRERAWDIIIKERGKLQNQHNSGHHGFGVDLFYQIENYKKRGDSS